MSKNQFPYLLRQRTEKSKAGYKLKIIIKATVRIDFCNHQEKEGASNNIYLKIQILRPREDESYSGEIKCNPRDKDDTKTNSNGQKIYGVRGDEKVQAQIKTYDIDETSSATGADIYQDGNKEHSNIHIGELQWNTNPKMKPDAPSPELDVEVDYYEDVSPEVKDSELLAFVEDNFRLYDVSLDKKKMKQLTIAS